MVPRALGRSGLHVSPIGLGTTKLGRNTDVKYPAAFALPSAEGVRRLLETCLALEINLIDTAPAYGKSEARLGPFIETHRERFVLCTKAGELYAAGRSTYDFSGRSIISSLERSLSRLRTDHADILLLHSDGRDLEILTETDAVETLHRLKQSGKTRAVGISAKTAAGVFEACRSLDVIMAPYSRADPTLGQALAHAHACGLGVLAIKTLQSGRLPVQSALEFALGQPFIDAVVLGTIDPLHLREAAAIAREIRLNVAGS